MYAHLFSVCVVLPGTFSAESVSISLAAPTPPAAACAARVARLGLSQRGLAGGHRRAARLLGQGRAAGLPHEQVHAALPSSCTVKEGLSDGSDRPFALAVTWMPALSMFDIGCWPCPCCRFTLHALALGSPRAVAELWSRFVSTLRLNFWEHLQPLPRMRLQQAQEQQKQQQRASRGEGGSTNKSSSGGNGGSGSGHSGGDPSSSSRPEPPNLETCLLHQKLQLLDLCIHLQAQRQQVQQGGGQDERQQQQDSRQGSEAALDWEASWGEGEEGEQQGQQGSQAALEWEASWGDGDSSGGREQPPSPSSSSSSYHSARAGSEASLSPSGERQQQRRQRQPQQAAAHPRSDGDASTGRLVDAEARGAVGVLPGATLHLHPSRPLWIPAVQEPPVHTEDTLAESQAALQVGVLG